MIRVVVVPASAAGQIRPLLLTADFRVDPEAPDLGDHPMAALKTGSLGHSVLYVPPTLQSAGAPHTIFVLHDGSPSSSAAVKMADRVAVRTGAEIVLMHVPAFNPATDPGSLPAPRLVDHSAYEWEEWRDEFIRRFCHCSPGVPVRVQVVTGEVGDAIARSARRKHDLIVTSWKGDPGPGRAQSLKDIAEDAKCPLLIVREPAGTRTKPGSAQAETRARPLRAKSKPASTKAAAGRKR